MSDALAAAFLTVRGSVPSVDFDPARPGFGRWISSLRKQGILRNDDVTLLRLDL
jgi:hypothetical protein